MPKNLNLFTKNFNPFDLINSTKRNKDYFKQQVSLDDSKKLKLLDETDLKTFKDSGDPYYCTTLQAPTNSFPLPLSDNLNDAEHHVTFCIDGTFHYTFIVRREIEHKVHVYFKANQTADGKIEWTQTTSGITKKEKIEDKYYSAIRNYACNKIKTLLGNLRELQIIYDAAIQQKEEQYCLNHQAFDDADWDPSSSTQALVNYLEKSREINNILLDF